MGKVLCLDDVRRRRRSIEDELANLNMMEKFIEEYGSEARETPKNTDIPGIRAPSIRASILEAVRQHGPLSIAEIIAHIHSTMPKAKASSIRSTASVLASKAGLLVRADDKYAAALEKS